MEPEYTDEEVKRIARTIKQTLNKAERSFPGRRCPYGIEAIYKLYLEALQSGVCLYCMGELRPCNMSVDHIRPRCKGGTWEISNLCVVCKYCNSEKGIYSLDEFLATMPHHRRYWTPKERMRWAFFRHGGYVKSRR